MQVKEHNYFCKVFTKGIINKFYCLQYFCTNVLMQHNIHHVINIPPYAQLILYIRVQQHACHLKKSIHIFYSIHVLLLYYPSHTGDSVVSAGNTFYKLPNAISSVIMFYIFYTTRCSLTYFLTMTHTQSAIVIRHVWSYYISKICSSYHSHCVARYYIDTYVFFYFYTRCLVHLYDRPMF